MIPVLSPTSMGLEIVIFLGKQSSLRLRSINNEAWPEYRWPYRAALMLSASANSEGASASAPVY